MKFKGVIFIGAIMLGSQSWAGNCSDMAAFNTQIDQFLNTASIAETLKADVQELATDCQMRHNQGMAVSSISSCGDALKLTMVN